MEISHWKKITCLTAENWGTLSRRDKPSLHPAETLAATPRILSCFYANDPSSLLYQWSLQRCLINQNFGYTGLGLRSSKIFQNECRQPPSSFHALRSPGCWASISNSHYVSLKIPGWHDHIHDCTTSPNFNIDTAEETHQIGW